jgi:osmotically-inducible protein OsmY
VITRIKSDAQIQSDALDELRGDTRVQAPSIGVEVNNGIVTLTGAVASYARKIAAREAAHRVAGVLDVVDDVRVHIPNSSQRTDTDIARAVRHALVWDVFVPEERIETTVSDGWVTLDGDVDSFTERESAEHAVEKLTGVRGVINQLTVLTPVIDMDVLRQSIESALRRRADREADRIGISVADGSVVLTGHVQSWAERLAIEGTVAGTRGVRHVDNQLHVGLVG